MPDLFSVTAPLAIRFPDGEKKIMIHRYPSGDGMIFLAPFWNLSASDAAWHRVPGPIKGEGPWKVGDAVVTVLGCHGTDAELAGEFSEWQSYREQCGGDYPDDASLAALAARVKPLSRSE